MKATREGYQLDSKNKNVMTIALNQRSVWKDEWGSKSSFNDIWALNWKLRNDFDGVEVTEKWRNLTKKWELELELFVIDVAGGQNSTRKIYWQEAQENEISLVIDCTYFLDGVSSCNLVTHEPNYGFNTSYIKISFHSELLPHWQEVLQDSKKLIDSFNVTH